MILGLFKCVVSQVSNIYDTEIIKEMLNRRQSVMVDKINGRCSVDRIVNLGEISVYT